MDEVTMLHSIIQSLSWNGRETEKLRLVVFMLADKLLVGSILNLKQAQEH